MGYCHGSYLKLSVSYIIALFARPRFNQSHEIYPNLLRKLLIAFDQGSASLLAEDNRAGKGCAKAFLAPGEGFGVV